MNCQLSTPRKRRKKRLSKHQQLLADNRHRYDELEAKQGGKCALCGRGRKVYPDGRIGRRFDMDHDHKRMVIRGLLCHKCNRALPSWMTSEWLRKAADYVDGTA